MAAMLDPNDPGRPSGRPPQMNYAHDESLPQYFKAMYGTWNMIYSWPPLEQRRKSADTVTFLAPSKLETAVFSCRCRPDNFDYLAPIKLEDSAKKQRVYSCQMVQSEDEALPALTNDTCCRSIPLATKFVLYRPIQDFVIQYIKLPNTEYTHKNPCHIYLLHRELPGLEEINEVIDDLELNKRRGGPTYVMAEKVVNRG